jgi:hypothetical protein
MDIYHPLDLKKRKFGFFLKMENEGNRITNFILWKFKNKKKEK